MKLVESFSFQGKVSIGIRNADGTRQPARWVYDNSKLEWAMSQNQEEQDESFSGVRGLSDTLTSKNALEVSLSLNKLTTENAALAMQGLATDIVAGTATAEPIGDVVAGDVIGLDFAGVSALSLKDGAAAALVENVDYTLSADTGMVYFLSTKAGVTADTYSYKAHSIVTALATKGQAYYLMFDGMNTVDDTTMKVRGEVHKIVFPPAATLALINDKFGSLDLKAKARVDAFRQPDPKWGPFARVILVDPNG